MMQSPMLPSSAMPNEAGASRGGVPAWIAAHTDRLSIAAILLALFARFVLIGRLNVNWDEFYFLELVHQHARGELAGRFQTFHVHLFSWLPLLGWDEIDQIVAGRAIMAVAAAAGALLTYGIARRFVPRGGALFGVLAYLSVTVVVEHGASFRVDPIVTLLSLSALFAILRRPGGVRGAALAGAAMALAVLLTVKGAFYVAVIGAAFWCLEPTMRRRAPLALAFAVGFLATIAALYLFHIAMLAPPPTPAGALPRGSAYKVLLDEGFFPRILDLFRIVALNPLFWVMLAEGAIIAWNTARSPANRGGWQALLPLVLALPILTPLFYRNAFPYFYPFILPPAAILVGLSFEKHRRGSNASPMLPLAALLVVLQCLVALANNGQKLADRTLTQRQTIAAIHEVFPDPVAYIDGFGAIASYPRSGFFMSSWGIDQYRKVGQPVFADLVAKDQPQFLIADSPSLYAALVPGAQVDNRLALLPEDARFLSETYVRHWGMLFVPGKHLQSAGNATFDIAIAGDYRFEATAPGSIDGRSIAPGDVVTLAGGSHRADLAAGEATLRWANAAVPTEAPTDPLIFFGLRTWAGMMTSQMARAGVSGQPDSQP